MERKSSRSRIKTGCSRCRECTNSLKKLLESSNQSISESLSGYKEDLHFVQAIVWLKQAIASMKEVSLEDFQKAFTYHQNSSENFDENSDIEALRDPEGDIYEPRTISQDSVQTIDLLLPNRTLGRNGNENNTNQKQSQNIEPSISRSSLLSFIHKTGSSENGGNNSNEHHCSSSDMFNESTQSLAFHSMSEPESDKEDHATLHARSGSQLTRGNKLQSFKSFPVHSSTRAAAGNFLNRSTQSFTNINNTHINTTITDTSCQLLSKKDDSGYVTMDLIPRSFKTRITHNKRTSTSANLQRNTSRKYLKKLDSELSQRSLIERASPERWGNDDSNTKANLLNASIISDSEPEDSNCTGTQSSASCFTAEFKYDKISSAQTNGTRTQETSTCSFGSLPSLNVSARGISGLQTIELSELFSCCNTRETARNDPSLDENTSDLSGSWKTRDTCRTLANVITPQTHHGHSEESFEGNFEHNFTPINCMRSDGTSIFRKSSICPLANSSNSYGMLEEPSGSSIKSTVGTRDIDVVEDTTFFTPSNYGPQETREPVEKLSRDYLKFTFDSLNADIAIMKFVSVIVSSFEDGRITRAYMKRRRWENTLEKDAIRTVLSFCYAFEAEAKTDMLTREIVCMVCHSLDQAIENTEPSNISKYIHHISIILEFLSSKDICIKTTDHLIRNLEPYATNLVSSTSMGQQSVHENSCKLQVLMYGLKICLKKYRLVRGNIEDHPAKRTTNSKDVTKEESIEEREVQWMDVLEKLPVMLVDDFYYLTVEALALKNMLISQ